MFVGLYCNILAICHLDFLGAGVLSIKGYMPCLGLDLVGGWVG